MSLHWKSASQMFKHLIAKSDSATSPEDKMTDDEIFTAVATEFCKLKVAKSHVSWNRSKMKRDAAKAASL